MATKGISEAGDGIAAGLAGYIAGNNKAIVTDGTGVVVGIDIATESATTNRDWQQNAAGDFALSTFAEAWALRLGEAVENNMSLGFSGAGAFIQRTAAEDWTRLIAEKPIYGKNNIFIPAPAWQPRTTNGCASLAWVELATNKVMVPVLDFDTASDEHAQCNLWLPKGYNASTVVGRPLWTAASGSGTVAWALQGRVYTNDDALDQAFGTEQLSTDTLLLANDLHEGPATSAITLGGTPAKDRYLNLQMFRDVSGDTLAVDARFIGWVLDLTTDAATDD